MDGQLIEFKNLPSRGLNYPEDVEIYVKPLTIKEQIDMDRYGISQAEYFQIVLDGISIHGNFNKNNLLYADVQFMDVVRRLYSFDTKDKIILKGETCNYRDCKHEFDFEFTIDQIEFTDFNKDIFNKHFIFSKGTDDELEVVVSPLTIAEFISMSKKARLYQNKKTAISDTFFEYCCICIREVIGRTFKDQKDRDSFLKGYLGGLCSGADKKTLKAIEDETVITIKPFTLICEECGRETEVLVQPTSNFQQ